MSGAVQTIAMIGNDLTNVSTSARDYCKTLGVETTTKHLSVKVVVYYNR